MGVDISDSSNFVHLAGCIGDAFGFISRTGRFDSGARTQHLGGDAMPVAPQVIRPQAGPQEAFLANPADIVIYGGAAGG